MPDRASITFHGGVHEIGGNKFVVQDKGTKILLDFGMQMGKAGGYFSEFLQPRKLNGMNDLFEFGLLPKLEGLYRKDYAQHCGFGGKEGTEYQAVLLTHAHVDHAAYIHYLRPDIEIVCSEPTKLILQALQETGGNEEYLTFKDTFRVYRNKSGGMSRASGDDVSEPRKFAVKASNKKFKIDSIEVEPLPVDHSVPGVMAFILHTSSGSIAYTADLRYHGRRRADTARFVQRCHDSDIDVMLCEGTRVDVPSSLTEFDVERQALDVIKGTKGLVVAAYPPRDLDRLLSFYNSAKKSGRRLVITTKQAHLLKLFEDAGSKDGFPSPTDDFVSIYFARKSWGLLGRGEARWSRSLMEQDYGVWEREYLGYDNAVSFKEVSAKQEDFVFGCSDYELSQLIDIRPRAGSSYIRSNTEPFDDEMELKEERVRNWLVHFGLLKPGDDWERYHVSGHASGDQIKAIIEGSDARKLIPIHTEHEEFHKKWHPNVEEVASGGTLGI